jgi:hypothetical protein
MKKYGFIYIWYDRKHKRYYIGSHWGTEDDGYVCSSNWMKQAYKRRSSDFKRRILERFDSKKELTEREHKWLKMIKPEELKGVRYYNFYNFRFGHWSTMEDSKTIGQKISEHHKKYDGWGEWSRGKEVSEETRKKQSLARIGKTSPRKGVVLSNETKQKISESKKGKKVGVKLTEDHKLKIRDGIRKMKTITTSNNTF